jgi:hypothetical protein
MRAPDPRLVPCGARRESAHPPARRRRIRQSAPAHRLIPASPAPQNESGDAGAFGGELQPAACQKVQPADFARHGGDPGSAQPLLHRPQDEIIAARLDEKEARGIEPKGGQARAIEISSGEAPQNAAACRRETPQNAGGKGGGERTILFVSARSEDLVQNPPGEPACGQGAIDRGEAKGDDPVRWASSLDLPHALAEPREKSLFRWRHDVSPLANVPILFLSPNLVNLLRTDIRKPCKGPNASLSWVATSCLIPRMDLLHWIAKNHLGDLASLAGVAISIVGFGATLWNVRRSKSAAERAEAAANEARRAMRTYQTVADFSAGIAIMEEIKRLHREGRIDPLLDRYAALRKALIGVRRMAPSLTPSMERQI